MYSVINGWSEVSFSLPQKVHKKTLDTMLVDSDLIHEACRQVRPYHGILLLQEEKELLDLLPIDANPMYPKFIEQADPRKSLNVVALDSNLTKKVVSI